MNAHLNFNKANDIPGKKQLWLNECELDRLDMHHNNKYEIKSKLFSILKQTKFALSPTTIEYQLKDELLEEYFKLHENEKMQIGEGFSVQIKEQEFQFDVELMRSHSSFPNQSLLCLNYRSNSPISVLYDVVCPELKYELVNQNKQFRSKNDYDAPPIFGNNFNISSLKESQSLTLKLNIRIVYF
jgi:hypothetical protein